MAADVTGKAAAFWARCRAARGTPGHCSRCGRPNPDAAKQAGKRGICEPCRAWQRAYKARRRAAPLTVEGAALEALARRVACLEIRCERFARFARAQYKAGYGVGMKAERKRWREMPRDWDAWNQTMDFTEKKKHFHRLDTRAAGA